MTKSKIQFSLEKKVKKEELNSENVFCRKTAETPIVLSYTGMSAGISGKAFWRKYVVRGI